ncbi:hypothetical protein AA14337_1712 [Acetobacter malorum DSM 14337]|uniref:Transposase n=1 Tax=Acetobacter malorum DSM 14337 TaxID=1307910 RepID=A0ABQ0PT35_9PROT|nr:hypothetical protein AA14337_1712 [Acetobacter malorum DSM 14337]
MRFRNGRTIGKKRSRIRSFEPRDQPQKGGLSASGWADQSHKLARFYIKAYIVQNRPGA